MKRSNRKDKTLGLYKVYYYNLHSQRPLKNLMFYIFKSQYKKLSPAFHIKTCRTLDSTHLHHRKGEHQYTVKKIFK
jgi:hypothetical protein